MSKNKVKIKIENLLDRVDAGESINSLSKMYNYSYATLYREVQRLKNEKQQRQDEEKKEKHELNISSNNVNFMLTNNVDDETILVKQDSNINIAEPLFFNFINNNKIYKIEDFEIIIKNNIVNFVLNKKLFDEVCQHTQDKIVIRNRVNIMTNGVYITNRKNDVIYCQKFNEFDNEKDYYLQYNNVEVNITNVIQNVELTALTRNKNIYEIGSMIEVNDVNIKKIREMLNITSTIKTDSVDVYPIIYQK